MVPDCPGAGGSGRVAWLIELPLAWPDPPGQPGARSSDDLGDAAHEPPLAVRRAHADDVTRRARGRGDRAVSATIMTCRQACPANRMRQPYARNRNASATQALGHLRSVRDSYWDYDWRR